MPESRPRKSGRDLQPNRGHSTWPDRKKNKRNATGRATITAMAKIEAVATDVLQSKEPMNADTRLSDLRSQLTTLRSQHRSRTHFREWKAGVFYYLFALPAAAIPTMFFGVSGPGAAWSFGLGASVMLCFAYLPPLANYLRFLVLFTIPNRKLQRQIDSLNAEIERLKAAGDPAAN
jgi:hypothetical protein